MVGSEKDAKIANAAIRADCDALSSDIREFGFRMEARIDAFGVDIIRGITRLFLGALVVNIVAIVGAMFGVAKLRGH